MCKAKCDKNVTAQLSEMLAEYREGERNLPTYEELAALVGNVSAAPHEAKEAM